jgi:hypothetical protein
MISELVSTEHGSHLPINVCAHCGHDDSPEDAACWVRDADDDRVCPTCAEREGLEKDE